MLILQYIKNVYSTFSDCGYHHPRVKTGTTLAKAGVKKIVLKRMMSSRNRIPPLPPGTEPMTNQVAGHKYSDGKIGCLQHEDGTLLKPVQYPPKGQREVDFYQEVFGDKFEQDKLILQLRKFLPEFLGIVHSPAGCDLRYLKLENLLQGIKAPCILDIKMGQITYDPLASPEKKALELAKFPPAKQLGYQLSGMQTYNLESGKAAKFDKYYCKKLTEETMLTQGLGKFFSVGGALQKEVIKKVISKLKMILEWFLRQHRFAFYASSILIVFDADHSKTSGSRRVTSIEREVELDDSCCHGDKAVILQNDFSSAHNKISNSQTYVEGQVQVRMIDFTHVFHSDVEDENYIFGLKHLINDLEILCDS